MLSKYGGRTGGQSAHFRVSRMLRLVGELLDVVLVIRDVMLHEDRVKRVAGQIAALRLSVTSTARSEVQRPFEPPTRAVHSALKKGRRSRLLSKTGNAPVCG